jgi:hypothetical protein
MSPPITVTFEVESEAALDDLYTALVRARAAELSEMRALGIQATVYHDRPRAGWQGTEADRAAARWQALDAAVSAVAALRRD